jgi:hypothetical protein
MACDLARLLNAVHLNIGQAHGNTARSGHLNSHSLENDIYSGSVQTNLLASANSAEDAGIRMSQL